MYSLDDGQKAKDTRVMYNFKNFLKRVEGKLFEQHLYSGEKHLLVFFLATQSKTPFTHLNIYLSHTHHTCSLL